MNICGVLVHCAPGQADTVSGHLETLPGVEVHQQAPAGRLIITVEDTETAAAADTLLAIHRMNGVISATLTFHSFEDGNFALGPGPQPVAQLRH